LDEIGVDDRRNKIIMPQDQGAEKSPVNHLGLNNGAFGVII
jgi:hypothetical protein